MISFYTHTPYTPTHTHTPIATIHRSKAFHFMVRKEKITVRLRKNLKRFMEKKLESNGKVVSSKT